MFLCSLKSGIPNTEVPLSARLVNGDAALFRRIYDSYYNQLVYYAYSFMFDTHQAEDIVTEAFVKLWNAGNTVNSEGHIKSYLFLAVKHAAIDIVKARQRHERIHNQLSFTNEIHGAAPDLAFIESEVIKEISLQIDMLPRQCAAVVRHILFDGMNTEEVAKEMGISTKNVLNQKALAIKKIQHALLKKGLVEVWILFSGFFC